MQNGYNKVMMYKARPIVDNKFWIVEQNGERIGTVRKGQDLTVVLPTGISKCASVDELEDKFNIQMVDSKEITVVTKPDVDKDVNGFPTKTVPFNGMFDIKRKLPLYTKTAKSQSFYCAGYYIIKFDRWLPSYCPKLLTLGRQEFQGPYKSKFEMQQALKRV